MSNYHVEAVDQPAALTSSALKSLRHEQVQGMSRRRLMRDRPVLGVTAAGVRRGNVGGYRQQFRRERFGR